MERFVKEYASYIVKNAKTYKDNRESEIIQDQHHSDRSVLWWDNDLAHRKIFAFLLLYRYEECIYFLVAGSGAQSDRLNILSLS